MIEREHLPRRKLLARLAESGAPGWTSYSPPSARPRFGDAAIDRDDADRFGEVAEDSATGSVLFVAASGPAMLVAPPFPIETANDYSELYARPLVELIERKRNVAALLLRRGGFTVGYFRAGALVDSKTDQRFVKNRHRKGGQSQRRFDRIREKQVHELYGKACTEARDKLDPYDDEIEHVLFGGDRLTLIEFRKQCSYFEKFGARVIERVLGVAGNPRRASLDDLPREIWSSEVYTAMDELPAPPTRQRKLRQRAAPDALRPESTGDEEE